MLLVVVAFLYYLSSIISASRGVICFIRLNVACHCGDDLSGCLLSLSIVCLILRTIYPVVGFIPLLRFAFLLCFVVIVRYLMVVIILHVVIVLSFSCLRLLVQHFCYHLP